MKKGYMECPFCANEIKEGAKKCQYCKEFLIKDYRENISKSNNRKKKNIDFVGLRSRLMMNEIQLRRNIKIGNSRINKLSRVIALRFPCSLFIGFISFLNGQLEIVQELGLIIIFLGFFTLLISIIYYFIWLIRNYKILFDSNIVGLTHKSYFDLLFCWICPILNFFKPKESLSDLLNNIANNFGEKFDKNITSEWQGYFNVTLVSFILVVICGNLRYLPTIILGILSLLLFIVFNIIQIRCLTKIIGQIIHFQEICLEKIQNK